MPFVSGHGATIYYSDTGSGAPVLLVHGGLFEPMDGERFWTTPGLTSDLAGAGWRLLLPDRRFAEGRTTADVAAHTWDVEADDLARVVTAAVERPAHVIAGSNGCSAAVRLARNAPQLVRSLLLCWPAVPENSAFAAAFKLSADWLEAHGPAAYVAQLDALGFPRLAEDRPGFPFGVALLNDERARRSFLSLTAAESAEMVRATGRSLLPGEVLRGLDRASARALGTMDAAIGVAPADPQDLWHPRATAEALAASIPGARLLEGFPVPFAQNFQARRREFATFVDGWLRSC